MRIMRFTEDTLESRISRRLEPKAAEPKKQGSVVMEDSIKQEEWLRKMERGLAKTHHHSDGSPVHLKIEKGEFDWKKQAGKDDYKPDQAPPRALCDCGQRVRLDGKDTEGYAGEKASGGYAGKADDRLGYDNGPATAYKA